MTLPDFAQTRDALQAALADYERYGSDCDLRIRRRVVLDVLTELRLKLAPAFPHDGHDFLIDMQTLISDAEYAFDKAIEAADFLATDPDNIAARYADYRRDMNR